MLAKQGCWAQTWNVPKSPGVEGLLPKMARWPHREVVGRTLQREDLIGGLYVIVCGTVLRGAASFLLFLVWLPGNMVCVGHHLPCASTRIQCCLTTGLAVWIFLNLEPRPFLSLSKSPQAFCSSGRKLTDKLWVRLNYFIPSPGCWWLLGILDTPWFVTLLSACIYRVLYLLFLCFFCFLLGCSLLAFGPIQTMRDDVTWIY